MSSSSHSVPHVQLAYPGEYLHRSAWTSGASSLPTEHEDSYTDKVGGWAQWNPAVGTAPYPDSQHPTCARCEQRMFLLTQLYVPATPTDYERILYIFACNKIDCSLDENGTGRSMKALRIVLDGSSSAAESTSASNASSSVQAASSTSAKPASSLAAAPASSSASQPSFPTTASLSVPTAPKVMHKDESSDDDDDGDEDAERNATPKKLQSPAAASSSSISGASAPSAASMVQSKENEWGTGGGWSSDEDASAKPKPTKKSKSKQSAKNDDDTVLSSLMGKFLQSSQEAKDKHAAEKLAAEEAAAKQAEREAKRQAKKEQKRLDKELAQQELLAAALQAQGSSSCATDDAPPSNAATPTAPSSSSTATPPPPPPTLHAFRPFYLAWAPEPTSNHSDLTHEMQLLHAWERAQEEEGKDGASSAAAAEHSIATDSSGGADGGEDDFLPEQRDEDAQTFFDRISRLPTQCVRYYGSSIPTNATASLLDRGVFSTHAESLWATNAQEQLKCEHCGARKVLELQLMPKLLFELHVDSINPKDPGMDWTTLDIWTCSQACQINTYIEETVHVQPPL